MIPTVRLAPKFAAFGLGALMLSACAVTDLDETPPPMGRFLLGHNIAVAENPEVGPASRKVSDEAWEFSVRKAVNDRFSRYDGDQYYHIAVRVGGYVLAQPGIPVVAAPKSVLIADVTIWDDAKGGPINEEAERFTVFEEGGDVIVGSGLTRTAEEQMDSLARNLAKSIHDWMLDNKEWFGDASLMDPATTSPGRPIQPFEEPRPASAMAAVPEGDEA
ncbi:hypothetical protein [Sinisalibacter aestuarii]|uniref:DUF3313 domain-containing protein n=1 Tax=Sinisalibacter aestuarii TaxID=2949426 RepID=A0ABQ5LVX0_9RHOB|nr:hypothetical protein [Sinisalibacter aestuarii]GKY88525.1 hypothetical protein STA1M1_23940 [Sinisalibacter aestuarii]